MEWWQWIAIGALLLGAETFVDAEFYLVFLGVAALAVGLLGLTPIELSLAAQVLLFAAMSVVSLVAFRSRLYRSLRPPLPDLAEGVIGEIVVANEPIEAGGHGRVQLRGAAWSAENSGDTALAAGDRARVTSASGLTLTIWPEA